VPKYDYRCGACGQVYEKREGFDAPSVQTCPECGGQSRRVLTPPAIVFKGSGWYVTDSRGSRTSTAGAGSSESASESTADSKPESKPDTKTAAASEPAAAD
jgi:putative FmdB family regulatory protein